MPSDWIRVEITATQGSTPRGVGASMWVALDRLVGSIGGGRLEFQAISHAQSILAGAEEGGMTYRLGPEMGQCCGGVVRLEFTRANFTPSPRAVLAIFGAGHIGAQLWRFANTLPDLDVRLHDPRAEINIVHRAPYTLTPIPEMVVDALPAASDVAIMTHDHGLDFLIAERALGRGDLGRVMMVGSNTKAAQFRRRFPMLAPKLICPIAKNTRDKRPEIVALAILQAVLQTLPSV